MFWGATDTAGPTVGDVLRVWDRQPRFLRPNNRPRPAAFSGNITEPRNLGLGGEEMWGRIASFWRSHYGGGDWALAVDEAWVRQQLSVEGTIVLGVFEKIEGGKEGEELVGTIVGRPFNSPVIVGERGVVGDMYVVEGLCVHRRYRGRHLAGWLIAWIDYSVNRHAPHLIVWSRETGPEDHSITHAAKHMYGFVRGADVSRRGVALHMPWARFLDLWEASAPRWSRMDAVFPTSLRASCPSPLDVWCVGNLLAVVSRTGRVTPDGEAIYEVVWMGCLEGEYITPGVGVTGAAKQLCETVAACLHSRERPVILFVTDAAHQGGVSSAWGAPWHVGTSGFHTTYLYNYMPPAFWSCRVMMPRIEI